MVVLLLQKRVSLAEVGEGSNYKDMRDKPILVELDLHRLKVCEVSWDEGHSLRPRKMGTRDGSESHE